MEGVFTTEYYIEPQLNILRGISEGEEIDNINSYINSGGWTKNRIWGSVEWQDNVDDGFIFLHKLLLTV